MPNALSYQGLLDGATQTLFNSSDSPRIDAEVLMQHVIDRPLAWLIAYGDTVASAEHAHDFQSLLERRQAGEPIAYITGHKEFWSLDLRVNHHVLVPRADTETLVEQALELLQPFNQPSVLDLGTGSGAIALAIAKERSDATVTAMDVSLDALDVAKDNAHHLNIHNVQFLQSNWFDALTNSQFDLITANPPYVMPGDPHLSQGDLRYEPDLALTAKEDGFADLFHIIDQAHHYLNAGGALVVEHGDQQAAQVSARFQEAGYARIHTSYDLNQLPRCTSAVFEGTTQKNQ